MTADVGAELLAAEYPDLAGVVARAGSPPTRSSRPEQ